MNHQILEVNCGAFTGWNEKLRFGVAVVRYCSIRRIASAADVLSAGSTL